MITIAARNSRGVCSCKALHLPLHFLNCLESTYNHFGADSTSMTLLIFAISAYPFPCLNLDYVAIAVLELTAGSRCFLKLFKPIRYRYWILAGFGRESISDLDPCCRCFLFLYLSLCACDYIALFLWGSSFHSRSTEIRSAF